MAEAWLTYRYPLTRKDSHSSQAFFYARRYKQRLNGKERGGQEAFAKNR